MSLTLRPAHRRPPHWQCLIGGAALWLGQWSAAGVLAGEPLAPPATAAQPTALPVDVFYDWPDMRQPVLSPSGRYLAVLIKGTSQRNRLAVLDLAEGKQAQVLASYDDADIVNVQWVGDEVLIYSLWDVLEGGADETQIQPGLISIARSGGKPRVLVKLGAEQFTNADPIGDRRLPYNHMLLKVPQDGSQEVIVGEIAWDDKTGTLDALTPKRLNVLTGSVRSVDISNAPPRVSRWLFDDQGEARVASYTEHGRTKVHWHVPGTQTWALLLDSDAISPPWEPSAIAADGTLYVTHSGGAGGTSVLARYDFERHAPALQATVQTPGFDYSGELVSDAGQARTLGVRTLTDGEFTVWLDPALQALQQEVDRRLPQRVNRISCRRCLAEDRVVLIESWSDHDPGSYLLWHGKDKGLEVIGRYHKAVQASRMASLSFTRITARDGRELPVWLTLPRQADPEPKAAVVLVHGGPWPRGSSWHWDPLPQFLASRGWVVIEPEMRGSTGYGREHFLAGQRQWGLSMQDDVSDALAWAVREQGVDPKRVCIVGGSYGGYAALMGLVRNPDQYRCAVALAAVSDLPRLVEGSWWDSDDISADARRYGYAALIGDPKTDAALLASVSPLQQAARIKAPVLLIHGKRDRRVPLVHAQNMREALRRNGQEPEWFTFPREGHGWNRLDNQRAIALKIESFLTQHLKK